MKATTLREKSVEELNSHKLDVLKDLFGLRMQRASGQLNQTHLLGEKRRELARVKMVLKEKLGK